MTLFDVLLQIEGYNYLPLTIDHNNHGYSIDCRPQSSYKIAICFMCEEETWITVSTYSAILIPWYDCEVNGIIPIDEDTIGVWLKTEEFLMERLFINHIKIVEEEDNEKA